MVRNTKIKHQLNKNLAHHNDGDGLHEAVQEAAVLGHIELLLVAAGVVEGEGGGVQEGVEVCCVHPWRVLPITDIYKMLRC